MANRQRDCRCSIFGVLKLNGMNNKVSVLARTFKSIVQKSNTNSDLARSINLNGLRVHLGAIGTIRNFNLAYRLAVNKDAHLASLGTQLLSTRFDFERIGASNWSIDRYARIGHRTKHQGIAKIRTYPTTSDWLEVLPQHSLRRDYAIFRGQNRFAGQLSRGCDILFHEEWRDR